MSTTAAEVTATVQTAEQRIAALEARITALESNADTAITKAGNWIAANAPSVLKYTIIGGGAYAAAKFGIVSALLKLIP